MSNRPTALRDLTWRIEAAAFDLASSALRLLPVDWASGLGAALFGRLGPLTGSHRIAERNIRIAFPEMTDAERQRLLAEQWSNLGRSFFEFPMSERLTRASGRVEVEGFDRLQQIAREGRATVFVSGHFSNWEVMPIIILEAGVVCQITYRAANNPYVDASIKKRRARYGVRLFAPKGEEGARELLVALGRGESVALMNDQKFNGGLEAPFFGRPVHTASGPTRLALRFGAALQPVSVQRTRGARFKVVVHDPIPLENTGDRARDLQAGVEKVNAFVEAHVRQRPAEWFWVHKRWPHTAYAELDEKGG
ncbi:MAG: lipid A biosynthesis acyltransferase [Caulobacterales bacterium 32-69-10]|nr:MAG: lipid A biosynthesis acyltransferase [Caulobacterales bacterium 32-69-10]